MTFVRREALLEQLFLFPTSSRYDISLILLLSTSVTKSTQLSKKDILLDTVTRRDPLVAKTFRNQQKQENGKIFHDMGDGVLGAAFGAGVMGPAEGVEL